jgi:hypothetical protein
VKIALIFPIGIPLFFGAFGIVCLFKFWIHISLCSLLFNKLKNQI